MLVDNQPWPLKLPVQHSVPQVLRVRGQYFSREEEEPWRSYRVNTANSR